jgi:ABC-type uncharacterized transport system substrate-binding protein
MKFGRTIFAALVVALTSSLAAGADTPSPGPAASKPRILHVMSYHTPWRWTEGQLTGFKEALALPDADYRVFEMDTKRNNDSAWKEKKGKEARALADSWKPDLIFTSDDDAQEYFAKYYVNSDTKLVFSGVNKEPKAYGYDKANNVTGVLEHEHFAASVRLLRAVVPTVKRMVVVLDDSPMWDPVVVRMKESLSEIPDVKIVGWHTVRTFEEYKRKMAEFPATADAVALIGIFNFKGRDGKNVPYQDVLRWTAENSILPDLGFWIDRVHFGTLVAVTVSEREQGLAAGRLARAILVDGRSPSSLAMSPTTKGLPVISLARARKLGINVRSSQLLSAEVINKFQWEVQ